MNEPVTVEKLIEFLKRLPPDAEIEVLQQDTLFHQTSVSFKNACFYGDGEFIDGIEYIPSLNVVEFGCR